MLRASCRNPRVPLEFFVTSELEAKASASGLGLCVENRQARGVESNLLPAGGGSGCAAKLCVSYVQANTIMPPRCTVYTSKVCVCSYGIPRFVSVLGIVVGRLVNMRYGAVSGPLVDFPGSGGFSPLLQDWVDCYVGCSLAGRGA